LPYAFFNPPSFPIPIFRLPQLRGRVPVHAEQMDDAAAETRGEALLPRHLLQGEPHSTPHKTVHKQKATDRMQLTQRSQRFHKSGLMGLRFLSCRWLQDGCICIWNITAGRLKKLNFTYYTGQQVSGLVWGVGEKNQNLHFKTFLLAGMFRLHEGYLHYQTNDRLTYQWIRIVGFLHLII